MRKATKKPNELKIPFSVGIDPTLAAEIDRLAIKDERSRSFYAEKLLLRGLAAFRRDGLLEEPQAEAQIQPRDVMVTEILDVKLNAPTKKKKAKV